MTKRKAGASAAPAAEEPEESNALDEERGGRRGKRDRAAAGEVPPPVQKRGRRVTTGTTSAEAAGVHDGGALPVRLPKVLKGPKPGLPSPSTSGDSDHIMEAVIKVFCIHCEVRGGPGEVPLCGAPTNPPPPPRSLTLAFRGNESANTLALRRAS